MLYKEPDIEFWCGDYRFELPGLLFCVPRKYDVVQAPNQVYYTVDEVVWRSIQGQIKIKIVVSK